MTRVLWVSESPRWQTGFGRVAEALTGRLSARYELAVLGWGRQGTGEEEAQYISYAPGPVPWDVGRMDQVIEDFAPDIVVTSGSLGTIGRAADLRNRPFVRWAGYCFFEAGPLSWQDAAVLQEMDSVVVASPWCQQVVAQAGLARPAHVIPLGVDPEVFRPLPDRDRRRRVSGTGDAFVVGCVARNAFRKQVPILIAAFSRLARDHADAVLYLHMDPDDRGWSLLELLDRFGVPNRVLLTRGLSGVLGVDSSVLNEIYNLFDVMALPTMGEAFGLPLLEAMAAGVPVLATDCSAVTQLVATRGELIRVKAMVMMPWDGAEYAIADEADLVRKLARLYQDRELRRDYAEAGRALALQMTWGRAASLWASLLDDLAPRAEPGDPGQGRRHVPTWQPEGEPGRGCLEK